MQRPTADPTLKERLATRIKLRSLIRTIVLIGFIGGVAAAGVALYPSVVGLNVGSGGVTESTTSAGPTISLTAAMVGTGPYYLNQTGATYVLAENITTRGTALVFAAQNVTLDLNGKTVTFNTDGNINRYGVALPPPYAHSNGKWSLSDITTWQASTGSTVKNGSIVQGGTTSANCQSSISNSPFCAALISNDEGNITVQNLNITVSVGDTFAMYFEGGGNFTVSGNTINDNTTAVINRSQGRAAIDFFEPSGTQGLEVFNNTINNARQWGIRVSRSNTATTWAHIYNNQIFSNTITTNGYGLGAHGGSLEIYGNTVHATNGRGIHIENNNIKVYNNDVDVVEIPHVEYNRVSAHGIKVEYGSGIEIYGNTVVSKGLVIIDPANPSGTLASNGSALNFSVNAGSSTYVHDNTFIARHLGGPAFDSGVYSYFATAIEGVEQWHETGNMGLRIENNTFISNDRFFTLSEWVPPGNDYANPVDVVGFSIKGNTFTREATTVPTAKKDVFFTQATTRGFRFIDNNGGDFRYVGTGWPWALNVYSVGYTGNVTARNSDGSPAVGVTIQAKDAQNVVTSATTNAQGVATFVLDAFTASVTNSAQFVEKNPYQITALFPSGSKSQAVTLNSAGWQLTLQAAAATDTTAPAAIANLAVASPTPSSIGLSWTAPGDDGSTGTAATYDLRYSTSAITAANYASALQTSGELTPTAAGTSQSMTVSGLSAATTYYFALKASDEVLNTSAISNVASETTSPIAAPLTANPAQSPTSGTAPLAVNFAGAATGGTAPYTYNWTFGDGQTSSLQNPSHNYAAPGTYTAQLTVRDQPNATATSPLSVSVTAPTALSAAASANPRSGSSPLTVAFSGTVAGGKPPYTYKWNFGDGQTSTLQNPSNTYSTADSFFHVRLNVKDSNNTRAGSILTVNTTHCTTNCDPAACVPNWNCSDWGSCSVQGLRTRICIDYNQCPVGSGQPETSESCVPSLICQPTFVCGDWSACVNRVQSRSCTDTSSCGQHAPNSFTRQSCLPDLNIQGADQIAPDTSVTTTTTITSTTGTVALQWNGTDDTTSKQALEFSTSVDGGSWSDYVRSTGKIFKHLSSGSHTIAVRSRDAAGNEDATPSTTSVTVQRALQIVVASRTGTPARVRTFDAVGKQLSDFSPFGTTFSGSLSVAAGDTTGDGVDEIISAEQGKGGSGEVMISKGSGEKIGSFAAFPAGQGVNVASADIDGDGQAEIVSARESGGEPVIKIFTPAGSLLREFTVFNKSFRGGVNVTSGDLTGDGRDELVVSPARSAKALVRILDVSGKQVRLVKEFVAGSSFQLQGTAVSVGNFGGQGLKIFTSTTEGGQKPGVKIYDAQGKEVGAVSVASDKFRGGVSIAAGDLVGNDNKAELTTVTYSGGTPNIYLFQDIEHPAATKRSVSIPVFGGLNVTGANIALGHLTP